MKGVHLKSQGAVCSGNAASTDSAIMFQRHLASETFSLLCRRGAVCCLAPSGWKLNIFTINKIFLCLWKPIGAGGGL